MTKQSYYVHGWHLGAEGVPDSYTIAPTGGGQMTTVSPGVLYKMYNEGLISSIQNIVKTWLNLSQENPFVTGTNLVTLRFMTTDKATGQALEGVFVNIINTEDNTATTAQTAKNGLIDVPNNAGGTVYNVTLTKSGYATLEDSFTVADDISFLSRQYNLTANAPGKQKKRLTVEFNSFVSLIPISSTFLDSTKQKAEELANNPSVLTPMITTIQEQLPQGWIVENVVLTNKSLSMDFNEVGSDPITLSIIAGIVITVIVVGLVALGLIIKSWKVEDLKLQKEETNQIVTASEQATAMKKAGFDDATITAILGGITKNDTSINWQTMAYIAGAVILLSVIAVALINKAKV